MSSKEKRVIFSALKAAFPYTVPIMAGFGFVGIAYGVYMRVSGFSFIYPLCMSLVIYGGSLEFIAVTLLMSTFAPVAAFLMSLMVQARHLFYGIAMLDKYKGLGWKRFHLIFGLCDETFSINYSADIPEGIDHGWFYLWVTMLDHLYWVCGATLGAVIGNVLPFDTTGIDFVMTAMFVVIFLDQFLKDTQPISAVIGLICSIAALLLFGSSSFLIPAMVAILAALTIFRRAIENYGKQKAGDMI